MIIIVIYAFYACMLFIPFHLYMYFILDAVTAVAHTHRHKRALSVFVFFFIYFVWLVCGSHCSASFRLCVEKRVCWIGTWCFSKSEEKKNNIHIPKSEPCQHSVQCITFDRNFHVIYCCRWYNVNNYCFRIFLTDMHFGEFPVSLPLWFRFMNDTQRW